MSTILYLVIFYSDFNQVMKYISIFLVPLLLILTNTKTAAFVWNKNQSRRKTSPFCLNFSQNAKQFSLNV